MKEKAAYLTEIVLGPDVVEALRLRLDLCDAHPQVHLDLAALLLGALLLQLLQSFGLRLENISHTLGQLLVLLDQGVHRALLRVIFVGCLGTKKRM